MEILIMPKYGTVKVSQRLTELITGIKAKEVSRYALQYISVSGGVWCITDGIRFLRITLKDKLELKDGLYYITGEGFLLRNDEGGNFPKHDDIIPKKTIEIANVPLLNWNDGVSLVRIIEAINKTKRFLNVTLLLDTLEKFEKCGCGSVKIFKNDECETGPVVLTTECSAAEFLYMQMPIKIE